MPDKDALSGTAAPPPAACPREDGDRPGRPSPRPYCVPYGPGHEGTRAALGPRSIRAGRTTQGTSGHPTHRSTRPPPGRSIPRSSLTTTRSTLRAAARPAGACQRGTWSPGPASPMGRARDHGRQSRATFVLTGHARCVPVAPDRKGRPRSTAATNDRPRAGRVADNLASHAGLNAPSKLVTRVRFPSPAPPKPQPAALAHRAGLSPGWRAA